MYERITKYAGMLGARKTAAPSLGCGTLGLWDFEDDFCPSEEFPDFHYYDTLKRYGVDLSENAEACDVEYADIDLVRACITWCVRGDHFCDGHLGRYAKNGFLDRCL